MKEFTVQPNNSGFVEGIEQVRLNQLLADIDADEFLAKQAKAEQTARELNGDAKQPFRVKPNNSGLAEGVDPLHLNRLIDEIEVEEFLAKQEADINPSPDAMSLKDAYGSVNPSGKPEDFKQITTIAKQAKAEQTARAQN